MYKVVIIGGGFGGMSALNSLYPYRGRESADMQIVVVDKKDSSEFLPLLPDVIGRGIDPKHLGYSIKNVVEKSLGLTFIKGEVNSVDTENKEVFMGENKILYDFLLIASGSETNFFNMGKLRQHAFILDTVDDAVRIHSAARSGKYESVVISGGGYTGVELAANLACSLKRAGPIKKIILVEKSGSILGALSERMKRYAAANIGRMKIEVRLNTSVTDAGEGSVTLSTGETINNSMLIWTAGVKTADFVQKLKFEKTRQGRIKVDNYLRASKNCYVIGDAAAYMHKPDTPLRMAVMFAIAQGRLAANNIVSTILGYRPTEYKPRDLGIIIPMANNRSCGEVLGMHVSGIVATALHYAMCVFRATTLRNKVGVFGNVIFRSKC